MWYLWQACLAWYDLLEARALQVISTPPELQTVEDKSIVCLYLLVWVSLLAAAAGALYCGWRLAALVLVRRAKD